MTPPDATVIVDVPRKERAGLEWILEESFEGWYLMHSKRTLRDIELVRAATSSGKPVGLVYLGLASKGRETRVERQHFEGDRQAVRASALDRALELLDSALD